MRQTRQVRRRGCPNDDTFRDFDLTTAQTDFSQVQVLL